MSKGLELQIGERVKWTVGRVETRGCYLEDTKDGKCIVIAHAIGNLPGNGREIEVVKSLLKLDIEC